MHGAVWWVTGVYRVVDHAGAALWHTHCCRINGGNALLSVPSGVGHGDQARPVFGHATGSARETAQTDYENK
jgi:hypothetical protein